MTPGGLLAAPPDVVAGLRRALSSGELATAVELAVAHGLWDTDQLTDMIFFVSHPQLHGRRIRPGEDALSERWLRLRDEVVIPALEVFHGPRRSAPAPLGGPVRSTAWLRRAWDGHACADTVAMVGTHVLGHRALVHPWALEAFAALDSALRAGGYRATSVGGYHCRDIRGRPGERSLHAFGLAVDVDPVCHPHRVGVPGPAWFSAGGTQEARCDDARTGRADTAFTPDQVAAVESIRTVDGLQVFSWGGRWQRSPDAMHFQINVGPEELRRGLDR